MYTRWYSATFAMASEMSSCTTARGNRGGTCSSPASVSELLASAHTSGWSRASFSHCRRADRAAVKRQQALAQSHSNTMYVAAVSEMLAATQLCPLPKPRHSHCMVQMMGRHATTQCTAYHQAHD